MNNFVGLGDAAVVSTAAMLETMISKGRYRRIIA
jgi:hypothetical protein